eukprot:UN1547
MLDTDEYTAKMFADPDTRHVKFDLEAVMQKLRESMRRQYPLVRDIFRRFDNDHDGVMTHAEFKRALQKFGFNLHNDEVVQIMRHFDTRRDGQVSYNEFCDALLEEDYHNHMMKQKPRLNTIHDEGYVQKSGTKTIERSETAEVRRAARAIGEVIYKKHNFLTRIFKEFGHITHESTVSCEQVQQAMRQLGHSFDIEDIQRAVLFVLPGADLSCVSYIELFKAMVASFHDLAFHR